MENREHTLPTHTGQSQTIHHRLHSLFGYVLWLMGWSSNRSSTSLFVFFAYSLIISSFLVVSHPLSFTRSVYPRLSCPSSIVSASFITPAGAKIYSSLTREIVFGLFPSFPLRLAATFPSLCSLALLLHVWSGNIMKRRPRESQR